MADTDTHQDAPKPMSDGDITPPPATTEFEPAAPLKDAGVEFEPQGGGSGERAADIGRSGNGKVADAKQAVTDGAASFQQQATDKVRQFAEEGKARAGDSLDQFAQLLVEAAAQVDEKLGAQYGDYARNAATSVQGFADTVRDKDVDAFAEDVRGFIRKSPAAAVGVTAALGFALARMVHAGLDQRA